MIFRPTPVKNVFVIEAEKRGDERGFFARAFCAREFAEAGLETHFVQANLSSSARKATLRGFHYQLPPAAEVKLVRCTRGAFYDAVLDLRPDSPSFGRWYGAELNAENRRTMYVPRGCAHALLTLQDDTEAVYFVSGFHSPQEERGVRYDDPKFAVEWPLPPRNISAKDTSWPDFDLSFHGTERMRGLI